MKVENHLDGLGLSESAEERESVQIPWISSTNLGVPFWNSLQGF